MTREQKLELAMRLYEVEMMGPGSLRGRHPADVKDFPYLYEQPAQWAIAAANVFAREYAASSPKPRPEPTTSNFRASEHGVPGDPVPRVGVSRVKHSLARILFGLPFVGRVIGVLL